MDLVRWLRTQGVQASMAAGGPRRESYEFEGAPVETVPSPDLRRLWPEFSTELTCVPGLTRLLRARKPDLAHCLLYQDATAARLARIPYLLTYAGMPLPFSFARKPMNRALFRGAAAHARKVTCPSSAVAEHLWAVFGMRAEVIPYAVDVGAFMGQRHPVSGRIFCAAAPGDPRKRIELLLAALPRVAADFPETHLHLAGPVTAEGRERLISGLTRAERQRVVFVGQLELPGLRGEYLSAQVSCLPSLYEAFGLVVIESLAAGTPVVGTRHGALPELISPGVGATFGVDDVDALAAALSRLLHENARDALAPACRRAAARYDFDRVGPLWMEAYEACL